MLSLPRSVDERTTSVTPLAAVDTVFCPWPSGTTLSAGHSPAHAVRVTVLSTLAAARLFHVVGCCLRSLLMLSPRVGCCGAQRREIIGKAEALSTGRIERPSRFLSARWSPRAHRTYSGCPAKNEGETADWPL